jgi:raffinose/stachyose/melibiose transport system permease protein
MTQSSLTTKRKPGFIMLEVILLVLALLYLFPVIYLLGASMKKSAEFYEPLKLPHWYFGNYAKVFEQTHLFQALGNTLYICAVTLAINILVSSMAGYIIGRNNHRYFQLLFYVFLSGMIIPVQTSMVPLFKLQQILHMQSSLTYLCLLYVAGGIPYGTMVYSGFIKSVPRELEESASIDGAGRFRTFWSIIFPLLLPATGTILVTTVFWYWNDFISPLLYLDINQTPTLITLIFKFKVDRGVDWGPIFSICVLATLPLIVLFLFTQKYLIKGFVAGAVKG